MSEAGPDKQFSDFLRAGRFMLQRSVKDGRYIFYPRVAAPGDGARLEWVEASGRGRVYSTTVVRKRPPESSYNVALIELAEGPRMMSRVDDIAPEAVMIGMAVRAKIVDAAGEPFVVFVPEDTAS